MKNVFIYFLITLLLTSCGNPEEEDFPESVKEITSLPRLSNEYLLGVSYLINSDDEADEAWGLYLRARDLVVKGASVESLPMIERSEILFRSSKNDRGLSRVLLLKAHSYWALGAGEEILSTSEETMALRQGDTLAWATAAGNYSTYLIDFGYYAEALEYSDTVMSIFRSRSDKINPSEAYAVRAEALFRLNKNPVEVDSLIEGALALVDSATIPDIDKQNIYFRALGLHAMSQEELAQCIEFANAREFWSLEAQARRQLKDYSLLRESKEEAKESEILANRRALESVDEGQSRFLAFELERGKRERLRFEEAAGLRQRTLVIILGSAILFGLILWRFYRSRLQTKQALLDVQEAQLELETYKNKIRPHFLFNQLNNVNGILGQERVQEAQEYLAELGQYLRALLHDQDGHFVDLKAEFQKLEKYAALLQQGSYAHVEFKIAIAENLEKTRIPSGILQPIVENSFKYVGNSMRQKPWIDVSAVQEKHQVKIVVVDSGYYDETPKGGTGHGLALVKQRLRFHKKRTRQLQSWNLITSFEKEKGTVIITVPFNSIDD